MKVKVPVNCGSLTVAFLAWTGVWIVTGHSEQRQHLRSRVIRVFVVSLWTFCLCNADVDNGRSNQGLQVVALPDTERDLGWFVADNLFFLFLK